MLAVVLCGDDLGVEVRDLLASDVHVTVARDDLVALDSQICAQKVALLARAVELLAHLLKLVDVGVAASLVALNEHLLHFTPRCVAFADGGVELSLQICERRESDVAIGLDASNLLLERRISILFLRKMIFSLVLKYKKI